MKKAKRRSVLAQPKKPARRKLPRLLSTARSSEPSIRDLGYFVPGYYP